TAGSILASENGSGFVSVKASSHRVWRRSRIHIILQPTDWVPLIARDQAVSLMLHNTVAFSVAKRPPGSVHLGTVIAAARKGLLLATLRTIPASVQGSD
ncbi:hypothetical protein, partial [Accumulibacter sp.]|uniref:hypothetical protein n=1 Tax=Accumulibacter sp. TaxID=2053492 RepID=UPI002D1196DD